LHLTLRGSNDDQRLDEKELFDPQLAVPDMVIERERNEEEPHRTVSQTVTIEKPAAEPKTPKWKIEIFRGSERVTEEVDLQDADDSESAPTAAIVERQQQPPSQQHLQQKQSKQSQLKQLQQLSGQPWMGTIRKLFGG
jgi:hypothetical protein